MAARKAQRTTCLGCGTTQPMAERCANSWCKHPLEHPPRRRKKSTTTKAPPQKSKGWDDKVLLGFALAVHDVIAAHDNPTLGVELMTGQAIGPDDFAAAGVSEDDMRVIRKAWRGAAGQRATTRQLLREMISPKRKGEHVRVTVKVVRGKRSGK